MKKKIYIEELSAREILDSRGNPTLEVIAQVNGEIAKCSVPSGASKGKFEVKELRDGDNKRYKGKGVLKAVNNVMTIIKPSLYLLTFDPDEVENIYTSENEDVAYEDIDEFLIKLDGTKDLSTLGGNAVIGTSIAIAKGYAKSLGMEFFEFLGGYNANLLPLPLMNILNGGAHSDNNVDIQEFMIMPIGAKSFKNALEMGTNVYFALKELLKEKELSGGVGDEGGFAPNLKDDEEALFLLEEATEKAGYKVGKDIAFALDIAASEWKKGSKYVLPKQKKEYTTDELIEYYGKLIKKHPGILSIEDPLDEEDFSAWKKLNEKYGNKIQIVGDDLYVTNKERLEKGIKEDSSNAILIKPNQVGTLKETLLTIQKAKENNMGVILSHRSGETMDTFISDIAVGVSAGQIKTGAPARGERIAKYNRLLEIEELLGSKAKFIGKDAIKIKK